MKSRIAGALAKMALLLASCLIGLLLCEAGLRLFHPKYKPLAEAPFVHDPNLVFIRIPNHCGSRRHPDTDALHPLCHNDLGLRQHRNFSAAQLESSVNIGFFGDSFVENINMEAQFSFTEPLDYLLNLKKREGGQGGVNVLNFGVSGYGTAQSLLRYELWELRETLDHVFYVYFRNDLRNNLEADLLRLDDAGRLTRGEAAPSRFALLSGLHLSYLALDAAGRLSAHLEEIAAEATQLKREQVQKRDHYKAHGVPQGAFPLFRHLLRRWKGAVESSGASFHLAWLPMEDYDAPGVAAIVEEEGVETFSLQDCFGERDPAHLGMPWPASPYRFEGNDHWSEAGNRLAAVCLHRFLEGLLKLPALSEQEVAQALDLYYLAFEAPAAKGRPSSPAMAAIRRTYDALEEDLPPAGRTNCGPPLPGDCFHSVLEEYLPSVEHDWGPRRGSWTPSPDKLAIRSRFDVYLHDGWLAYVKEDCKPADLHLRFFLHVWPVDVRDLPPDRLAHGFDNLDFWGRWRGADQAACTVWRKLPDYAIAHIGTGQYSVDDNGDYQNIWEGRHALAGNPTPDGLRH